MFIKIVLFGLLLSVSGLNALAQEAASLPVPTPTPAIKTNARPAAPAAKPEPFDGADVKKMAAQCVFFDTEAGVIAMEMFPEHAPEAVRSFLNIVSLGYLDTTTFSRVVPGFIIQGGDLYSREGEVTYEIGMRARKSLPDEPNKVLHERGVLSMARGEEANTATTNFFILTGTGAHLDGKFAAFGRVTKGMDVVDAINKAPVKEETPEKPVRIKTAKVAPCGSTTTTATDGLKTDN